MKKDVVIKVEGLGKRYEIGSEQERHLTLRDQLVSIPNKIFSKNKLKVKSFWALKGISFEVKKGEVIGVIGRNGAGKSTLLKILSKIVEPTSGKITMKGKIASLLEVGTGFNPELTGRENIFLSGAIIGMSRKEIGEKFNSIVEFSGVKKFIDTPVKRYSSGMYVRLAFAVAAHLDSDILLIDEVLAVGDAEFQKKCLGKMSDLSSSGRTVIFVSHQLNSIKSICKKTIMLEDGQILHVGNTSSVINKYLNKSSKNTLIKRWDKNNAPQNTFIRINKVAVLNKNGKQAVKASTDDDLYVNIHYSVIKNKSVCGLTLVLYDNEDRCILGSINNHEPKWFGNPMDKGEYISVCKIPKNLLNNIKISVSINIFGPKYSEIVVTQNVLVIELNDGQEVRKDYLGNYDGAIRPLFEWETRKGE